jgi:hypothetical protein
MNDATHGAAHLSCAARSARKVKNPKWDLEFSHRNRGFRRGAALLKLTGAARP